MLFRELGFGCTEEAAEVAIIESQPVRRVSAVPCVVREGALETLRDRSLDTVTEDVVEAAREGALVDLQDALDALAEKAVESQAEDTVAAVVEVFVRNAGCDIMGTDASDSVLNSGTVVEERVQGFVEVGEAGNE